MSQQSSSVHHNEDAVTATPSSSQASSQRQSSSNFYQDPNAFHIDQAVSVQVRKSKTNFIQQQQQQQSSEQNFARHGNDNDDDDHFHQNNNTNNNNNNNNVIFSQSQLSHQQQQQQQQHVSRTASPNAAVIPGNASFPASYHHLEDHNNNNNQNQNNIDEADDSLNNNANNNSSCMEKATRPLRIHAAYAIALVVTAINLLFFLCLSVLLVMVSVDILISLIVQCALPPDPVYAFAGAALICVVFPWIAVWISTVADYSRWPAKFYLLHYHLRVFFNVQEPFRPITAFNTDADRIQGALNRQIHESEKEKEKDDPAIAKRSRTQVAISLIPCLFWLISLIIGIVAGKDHNYGTVFFLVTGFLFVIFITVFEYDVAPVAPAKTSILAFRSSEASSLRHILLHHRKFDLSLVGIASAFITSLIVFLKDPNAVGGGISSFLLSIVVLAIAFCAVLSLRWKVKLSVDKREMERRARQLHLHRGTDDFNINRGSTTTIGGGGGGTGNPTYSQLSNHNHNTNIAVVYQGGGGVMSRSIMMQNNSTTSQAAKPSARNHNMTEKESLLLHSSASHQYNNNPSSAYGSTTSISTNNQNNNKVRDPQQQALATFISGATTTTKHHNNNEDAESMSSHLHRQGESNLPEHHNNNNHQNNNDSPSSCCLGRYCSKTFLDRNIDFVLLVAEIIILFAASLCITIDTPSPKESWSVWLGFIFCTLCTVGLWYMQIRLQNDDEETDRAEEAKKRACHKAQAYLASEIARNKFDDDETRLVKTYEPARVPPDAVYRISYFVVAFVSVIVVFVAIFSAHRESAAARAGVNATFFDDRDSVIQKQQRQQQNRLQHSMSGYWSTTFPSYAICATLFPGNFSIVDIAALAAVSDMNNKEAQLEVYFPSSANDSASSPANKRADYQENKDHRVDKSFLKIDYYTVRFPERKVTVIVARGAFNRLEALQQLYVLSDSVALELAIMLLPLPFGDRLLAAMIRVVAVCKFGMYSLPDFAVSQAQAAMAQRPDENVLLVGFSLGGFVTNIAASKIASERVHSVTISPIGCGFQSLRFGFSVDSGDKFCTSVSAQDDVLAKFDQTMGLQQKIVSNVDCNLANSFCHDSGLMLDSLSSQCGDTLKRTAIVED